MLLLYANQAASALRPEVWCFFDLVSFHSGRCAHDTNIGRPRISLLVEGGVRASVKFKSRLVGRARHKPGTECEHRRACHLAKYVIPEKLVPA
jgi:hypothetical protein